MDRKRQVLGKRLSCTTVEALLLLEASIVEGLVLPNHWQAPPVEHLFGRKTLAYHSTNLSFLAGLAAGGLRASAFVQAAHLAAHQHQLQELARNHSPALIICLCDWSSAGRAPVNAIKSSGCLILRAASAQEAIHLAVVGHLASELTLTPVVLLLEVEPTDSAPQEVTFPDAQKLAEVLGEPDEPIASPTPAQRMIFGKHRRRIPNWNHFDYPTQSGGRKTGLLAALEYAARQQYFEREFPEQLEQAFEQFKRVEPAAQGALYSEQIKNTGYLLITSGPAYATATDAAAQLRKESGDRVGCAHLAQVHPLPYAAIEQLITGKKAVSWLAPESDSQNLLASDTLRQALNSMGKHAPEWYSATAAARPDPGTLLAVFKNMLPKGAKSSGVFTGVAFSQAKSDYPQHEILLQTLRRNFPDAEQWSIHGESGSSAAPAAEHRAFPLAIRRHKDQGPPYTRSTRFYHNLAGLYADGATHELVADPFQALPIAPAGAGSLAASPAGRTAIPQFKPEMCTACGECLVHCPHSALPPLAISVEQLLRGAMDIAGKQGSPLTQLTPLLKPLGKIAGQILLKAEAPPQKIADFLPEAYSRLVAQMKLESEKLKKTDREIEVVSAILATLPLAATQALFTETEQQESGSGALFTLALDTQACTGCGICAAVCAPAALEMTTETPALQQQAMDGLELWEQLPDTSPAVLQRLHHREDYNPFAAILLSRHNYFSFAGTGIDEHAPRNVLMHLLTAMSESIAQPNIAAQCREIEQSVSQLAENIHKLLGAALPAEGSPALMEAIAAADGRKLPLDEIMGKLSGQEQLKLVDTAVLQRKVQLVNDLKELLWTLKEGPSGMGRARYGLFFPGNTSAPERNFPFHPFQAPAFIAAGSSADMGLGLFEAKLRHTLDNIRLLRRAKLEIKNQYRPEVHDEAIAGLSWDQLDAGEKNLVAPLLIICNNEQLPAGFIEQIPLIMSRNYPVKIVVLDHAALPPDEPAEAYFGLRIAMLQAAQASSHAGVFMGALAKPKTLFEGLLRGMHTQLPTFFLLHCPDPALHLGADTSWLQLPERALNSRALPYFHFNPEKAGPARAPGISLEGNPDEHETWAASATDEAAAPMTFADWLFSLKAWQDHFREIAAPDQQALPLHEFLALGAAARVGKTGIFHQLDTEGTTKLYAVSEQVVGACLAAGSAWNQLREMAGALSPHPQKLWAEAEAAISAQYEAQIQELKQDYENRSKQLEQEFLEKTRLRLREKLLALASTQKHKN